MAIEKKIEYIENKPDKDDLINLFISTGWNEEYMLSPKELYFAINNSYYCISAYCYGVLVGFGRVVSDGVLHAMIYELITRPSFQGFGVGSSILEKLVAKCKKERIRDIQLFCANGKRNFYEKRGFIARPVDDPGMQYKK
jgi:GNAT superfamily N-acetyltransferase